MGYINFKEEKYKARIQIDKRKRNNENLYNDILRNRDSISEYFPDEKYSFNNFEGKLIGKKGILGEEEFKIINDKDIICTKFIDCNFSNIKFENCRFIACIFDDCEFEGGGVIFENCIMVKEDSDKLPSLNRKDNLSCGFYRCNVYAKFLNSDISYTIFEDSKIINTSFEQSAMNCMIINNSELNNIVFEDCDFSGGKVIDTYIVDLSFNDKYCTKFDEKNFFDKIKLRVRDKQEYEGVYMTYETLANKFKENSLNNNFGEYYYLAKRIESKCVPFFAKVRLYIYWLTCGYGERPEFALYSGLFIIVIFAILYLFTGINIDGQEVRYAIDNLSDITWSKFVRDINETINLSVGTFGGVGCINCEPTEVSYIISNIEVIIGVVMMGLGIGTLTRKIVR